MPLFLSYLIRAIILLTISSLSMAEPLRVGSIAAEYVSEVRKFKLLTEYMEERLRDYGVDRVEIVVASSIKDMAEKIRAGEVDLFIDSPYPAIVVSQLSGSKMLLRRWKRGVDRYHSVIFVHHKNPSAVIDDLRGKEIAFEEPFSTAGYFLSKAELIKRGLLPVERTINKTTPAKNEILYQFSGGDSTTVAWVLRKRIDAGVLNNHKFNKLKEKIRDQLRIIHHSDEVPRHIVSFRAELSEDRIKQISDVLVQMERDETGKTVLYQFQKTKKFDSIPAEVKDNIAILSKIIDQYISK